MLRLKVRIILWASFIKFFRASGEGITAIYIYIYKLIFCDNFITKTSPYICCYISLYSNVI